tara:strand:+ start:60 stop:323 length:264 start_codon:yes stop_codon:yes gene_type:complete
MAFKMKGFSGFKSSPMKQDKKSETKVGQYTTSGIPKFLYDADGAKINTVNIDEGVLSKIKVESGTNRKYVEYTTGSKQGGRLYLKNK